MGGSVELLINGLLLGALYALFALGLSLSLGVMKTINLAHGDFIVLGAYLSAATTSALGWPPHQTLLVVLPLMFALGWLLQRGLLNRLVGHHELSSLLVTFGLSVVVQNVLLETFTANTRSLQAGELGLRSVQFGAVSVGLLPLLIAAVCVGMYGAVHLAVRRSHWGRQARAVADDPGTARLVGVDDQRFFALVAGLVMAATGIAAVLYGIRTPFAPTAGTERLLFAFEAVVLGGLGSLWGSLVGGLLIGLAQVLGAQVSTGLGPFFAHLVFLLVLLVRPQGLFALRRG